MDEKQQKDQSKTWKANKNETPTERSKPEKATDKEVAPSSAPKTGYQRHKRSSTGYTGF